MSVIFTWHLLSKHNEPITRNVLIWGYFEVNRCKICSPQKLFPGSKTHFCLEILWIFEICPGVDFMTI